MKLPKPFEKFGPISNIAVGTIFEKRKHGVSLKSNEET